jgi:hypothetical protein
MRHIPEDELHAYLDQGLSRSQCVEIESHLAACSSCRANRDGIAALRDRTTALLAQLAPPRRFPPAYETIRALAAQRVDTRRRRIRAVAWAASLIGAVGLGWGGSAVLRSDPVPSIASSDTRSAPSVSTALVEPAKSDSQVEPRIAPRPVAVAQPASEETLARQAARRATADSIRAAKLAVLDPRPAAELQPLELPAATVTQFEGMWRTMSWDGAQSEVGQALPHIDGLPVLRVQLQDNDQGKRPLMVVAQQLSSGQVIQTIEGPAADVSQLLSRRTATSPDGGLAVTVSEMSPPGDQAMAMQVGDRMLAITGALPSDSLRAMIRRINAEMRSK